ncbi:MAG: hypothetical protein COV35_00415 [Alphaproteobacteria bacterium CG11_big_fil_rev_8_21_14_0_20_39_49]|nr:MAG: hypothetical protein COV35_00415 [Alphaproteobacteria bacterium CG11_big_fil_rev_8_21_14_0_20_39_49]
MTYQTAYFKWKNIDFILEYTPEYYIGSDMSHIQIRCKEPLPITETGYKSIFLNKSEVTDIQNATDLVMENLDETAKKKGWNANTQLSFL